MSSENNDEDVVIRVRGLPWSATAEDIIKFFDDIPILDGEKGVHMTLSREGRPSGEAYVVLENLDDVERAEKKHNQHMGRRYIEVFEAKRSEMEWVIKRAGMAPGHESDCCVRLRGLPFGCSKEEVMQFFSGLEIVPNGIALPTDYQGRHTGEAYVQFTNDSAAQKAMTKHKEKIAHRYIEIFKCNLNEIRAAMSPKMRGPGPMGSFSRPAPYDSRDRFGGSNRYSSSTRGGRGGRSFGQGYNDYEDNPSWGNNFNENWGGRGGARMGGSPRDGGMKSTFGGRSSGPASGHSIHMRGLPFRATEFDIAEFFRPLNPINISIQMDSSSRPSGEADVEFSSHEEASRGMNKDKANMQNRYIELFLNSATSGGAMGGNGSMGGAMCGPMGGNNNFNSSANGSSMNSYGGGHMSSPGGGMPRMNSGGNGGSRSMYGGGANRMGGGGGGGGGGNGGGFGNNMSMSGGMNGAPSMGGGFNNFGGQGGPNQMSGSNYNSFC